MWSKEYRDSTMLLSTELKKLVTMSWNENVHTDKTTLGIIDAQSVPNADTTWKKGYGAKKKVNNVKWLT